MPQINQFFEERTDQSRVKSTIVEKYFEAWAQVMIGHLNKRSPISEYQIAYIDLFSGPGLYNDGTESTPIMILKKAVKKPELRKHLVTFFTDKQEENIRLLHEAIDQIPGIELLKHRPQVKLLEVGPDIDRFFEQTPSAPTLFFVDPWGYKGLSLSLINSAMRGWGSECIFFFNYIRINMGLNNPLFMEHMDSLFGAARAAKLRQKLETFSVQQREMAIIEDLCQALKDLGFPYILPFGFKDDRGTRTSHHLIFVSKAFRGYEIMKNIMANECSSTEQGVPSFEYNPVDARFAEIQPLLFQLSRPIDDLAEMLLSEFAGQTITMKDVYVRHNVGRRFISKNYKKVLLKLEQDKRIIVPEHRKGTLPDNIYITFPPAIGGCY